ncbi:MAG: TonB-dependent siderophore receptor [Pseudomonas sp.]|uniref:TonB-dependent siderophore receptor n=1 Tax=Pseudomonas sp. TaxID=306 RepID=UPI0033912A0B
MPTHHPLLAALALLGSSAVVAAPLELSQSSVSAQREPTDDRVYGYRAHRSSTATRTDTDLRDTPQSIAVVPRQVLDDLNLSRIDRALDFAGGVSRQNNFGGLTFLSYSVRGFTTGELYRNGFAINRGSASAPDTASLERIEVLKGPAASLYGRGDPGGMVNIVSKKPQPEAFIQLKASTGSWDRHRSSLDVNAPLSDDGRLLSRVNLAIEDNQSFRDQVGNRRKIVSPAFSWQLDDSTRLALDTEFSSAESVFDRGIPAIDERAGALPRDTYLGEPNDGRIDNRSQLLQAVMEHALNPDWTLRLASHYSQGSLRGDSSETVRLVGDQVSRFYRQRDFEWNDSITRAEVQGRFALGGWEHQTLAGLEYENYRNSQKYPQSLTSLGYGLNVHQPLHGQAKPALAFANDFAEHTESQALGLQDQILFSERWRGLAGMRLERVEQDSLNRSRKALNSQSQTSTTARLGLLYQLTPEVGLFANGSTSAKPNGFGSQGQAFDTEQGLGYETGLKLDLFDSQLGATLALFQIDKQNVLTADPRSPGDSLAAGEARSRGLDLQFSGQLSDALQVIGAYAYIDAEVTRDNLLPAGTRLLGVARHNASLMGLYQFHSGPWQGLGLGAAAQYVGDRSGQAGSDFQLAAYSTVDLLAQYRISEQLSLGANLNNLFDRHYQERSYNSTWVLPGEPRNFSLNLTLNL